MKPVFIVTSLVALSLTACDAVSERECGVFDHPDLAAWQADTGAGEMLYMNEEGTMLSFSRQAVVLNEPFLGTDGASNDEDVVCQLTATITMQAADSSLQISALYLQQERTLLPVTDESLFIDFDLEAPVGTPLSGTFLADITTDEDIRVVNSSDRVTYLETQESTEVIGGQSYVDVVRINAIDSATDETEIGTQSIDFVQQIVIAREFGVVAFTDAEGMEFVFVP